MSSITEMKSANYKTIISKPLMSFNETGQEVSKMRACLERYMKSKPSGEKKNYRMKYWDGDDYFGIDYHYLVITATSRLEAIFKLKDYFNQHAKCPRPFDAFVDDSFDDIVSEYEDITDPDDLECVFKSKHIDEIINRFVEGEFNNDSLWLEEVKTKPVKNVPMTFNETGQEVSKMRACLKRYLKSHPSGEKKNYRMKYWEGDEYFGIKYDSLVITATSRLKAVFKLMDYFNQHAKYPRPFDAFVDDCFNDIVSEYEDITDPEDPECVFKSKHIDEIINRFVENEFNNDSLWLEECDEVEECDE